MKHRWMSWDETGVVPTAQAADDVLFNFRVMNGFLVVCVE